MDLMYSVLIFVSDISQEVYIGYLRAKLEAEGESRLIHTVRGIGYVFKE